MSRSAKLTSIDAVRQMAAALARFGEEATAALDHLDMSVRRAREWIHLDRKEYWEHEVRHGGERVGEARAELEKALTYRGVAGERPSCRQERAMLEKAKLRLRTAEEKTDAVRRWAHEVEHAVLELAGGKEALVDWLHAELPRALAALGRKAEALDSYVAAATPAASPSPPSAEPSATTEPAATGKTPPEPPEQPS